MGPITFTLKNQVKKCAQMTYKSDDNQTRVTYKSLILSHLTYKSGDLLESNKPLAPHHMQVLNNEDSAGCWYYKFRERR